MSVFLVEEKDLILYNDNFSPDNTYGSFNGAFLQQNQWDAEVAAASQSVCFMFSPSEILFQRLLHI